MASIYEKTERIESANTTYISLIESLPPIQNRVQSLGKNFMGIGKYKFAEQTYLKGQKNNKSGYQFNLELAELYAITKKPEKMVNEYLNLLEYSSAYLKSVQTYLSRQIDFTKDETTSEYLRTALLTRIQSNPNKYYYNEMLIWYYIQKKEYTGAIIQAKALDKKKNSFGKQTFLIGNICKLNKNYKKARQAYKYVIGIGERSPYYKQATQNNLEVSFLQVTENGIFDKAEVESVRNEFEIELNRLGKSSETVQIISQLSKIYAFYLDESEKAQALLNETLLMQLKANEKAKLKILLGDILVSNNEIWDASILYMQVANQFKEDKIGHEAKFKNAKVFYYDGEFEYAKTQLDVLKASTSKLIANDAMQLSLLLQDNLGIDTTQAPIQMYAQADLLIQQNKFDKGLTLLDSINILFPFHSIADEILYQKGIIHSKMNQWHKAIFFFEKIIESYSFDILADDAIFRIAEIYDYRLDDPEKASEYYKKILFDYSSSLYTAQSRERYRAIKSV